MVNLCSTLSDRAETLGGSPRLLFGTTQTAPSKEGGIAHVCTSDQASILERMNPSSGNVSIEDDRNFMVGTKRILKANEYIRPLPIMDRHENNTELSMGNCSKTAPGVNVQEEDREEDTDLVKLLRSSLSKSSLDSLSSMCSEEWDYRCAEVKGDLVFSLDFDDEARIFSVFIKECHNLAYGHFSKRHTNPYVKCYLLPWRSPHNKRRTSIKYDTVNPTYNENLKFSICRSQLVMRTLLLSVWHHDIFNHDRFLGEVELPLDCRDLGSPHEECVALRGKVTAHMLPSVSVFARHKGQLAFSLKYLTTDLQSAYGMKADSFLMKKRRGEGELHVCIKEAKNLISVGAGCRLDSFVKGYLLQAKNMADKRKTPVVRMSMNPQYNHTFIYKDLGQEQLKKLSLELTVWEHEIMSRNHFLGGICLNSGTAERSGTTEEEVRLWQMMMQYPDSWVEGTVPLCSYTGHNNKGKSFLKGFRKEGRSGQLKT
ncbi:hypothetical protein GJAV_G00131250 [Gymnothorax javanicus]|nr:hypothetical protein GJAV_G00131250 [Gymnothorax javanicus]